MGFLDIFGKTEAPQLIKLPSGSFTVDSDAQVVTSTLPNNFPKKLQDKIALQILNGFKEAQKAGVPLTELVVHYSAMKITARSLRGGAIIFLAPHTFKRT